MTSTPSFLAQFVDSPNTPTSVLRAIASAKPRLSRPTDQPTFEDLERLSDAEATLQWAIDRLWMNDRSVLEDSPDASNWDCIRGLQSAIYSLRSERYFVRSSLGLEPHPNSACADRSVGA